MENLDKIQRSISLLSEVYYKATLNHARIFLYIAARNNEIIETRDLPDALGMTQTTINRCMNSFADKSYLHSEGFGLLSLEVHPEDNRQRIVSLTTKGKALATKMMEIAYD
jgi:DNA-binding MarR family transcriptional regulator